ncbi:unnamed protein product [Blepharisma stoltei]|uniref:Uncharacterized protein n=1 Tax=Blepharisma stoltei TaxID=1481888 RepID=A0AAU9IA95_9CILI|nr:unnamed protein product [Blepharisma stoltei]
MVDYCRALSNISEVSERNEHSERSSPTNYSSQFKSGNPFKQLSSISEDESDTDISPELGVDKNSKSGKGNKSTAEDSLKTQASKQKRSVFNSNQNLDQLVSMRINGDKCSCTCIMF